VAIFDHRKDFTSNSLTEFPPRDKLLPFDKFCDRLNPRKGGALNAESVQSNHANSHGGGIKSAFMECACHPVGYPLGFSGHGALTPVVFFFELPWMNFEAIFLTFNPHSE